MLSHSNEYEEPTDFYGEYELPKGDINDYEAHTKIGRGRYSEVFIGNNIMNKKSVIIKILKPIKKEKICREVKILKTLRFCPNIIQIQDVIKDSKTGTYCLVFEDIGGIEMKKISMMPNTLKEYMYKILQCLQYTHSHGFLHRDIKPGNIVINSKTGDLRVIDWGLAEIYIKRYEYNVRVSSRYYKAPELLLEIKRYNGAIDLWSLGCLFAAFLFKKDFFFKGEDLRDQLIKICRVLGTERITEVYGKECVEHILGKNYQMVPKVSWSRFINDKNRHFITQEALDLLDCLLEYDFKARITADKALKHDYFKDINTTEEK